MTGGFWFWLLPSILTLFMMDDFTLWYKKHGCHCHVLTWLDKPWSYQPVRSHHPFPSNVLKQDKTRQKLKNKNILIFSSTQLGLGTCSRINSWALRSKNLEVDIAILWIGLGKDQFWRKQGALGETEWQKRWQQRLAFLSLRCSVPSVFPGIVEAVVLLASPSLRHNTKRGSS